MNSIEMSLYKKWLEHAIEDEDVAAELKEIKNSPDSIQDRFYCELEFGTGGLRGKLGAGSNRMNIYTIRKATLGLASYLRRKFDMPSVAISYDSRRKSRLFADETAKVFQNCGVSVKIFDRLMPTPMLSYAVRRLKCSAGVMVTASHNPAEYNGYKVYGADGCQITDEAAAEITQYIEDVDVFEYEPDDAPPESNVSKACEMISGSVINDYYSAVLAQRVSRSKQGAASKLSIVYSPLHGAGLEPVVSVLKKAGYESVHVVPSQREPDGGFPTCPYPNPEMPDALSDGMHYCNEIGGDLLLATDPDCDRVGVVVSNRILTGNEIGVLLLDYICKARTDIGSMPDKPVAVKTIVTTDMAEKVAAEHGVKLENVLTGFKYIGEFIGELEAIGNENRYIFGFEESCGYLSGTYARDKDAVNAVLLICDMAAYYTDRGLSLIQRLEALYERHGYYECALDSFSFEGALGAQEMQNFMSLLRNDAPNSTFGLPVKKCIDYLDAAQTSGLPQSDVLQFTLADDTLLTIRPSGTEPKMKVYYQVTGDSKEQAQSTLKVLRDTVHNVVSRKNQST